MAMAAKIGNATMTGHISLAFEADMSDGLRLAITDAQELGGWTCPV